MPSPYYSERRTLIDTLPVNEEARLWLQALNKVLAPRFMQYLLEDIQQASPRLQRRLDAAGPLTREECETELLRLLRSTAAHSG